METRRAIQGLGEIALRVSDLDTMQHFYGDVIGLELLRRFPESAFFRVAAGAAGHTQILALFDRGEEDRPRPGRSPLDHLAFAIAAEDYDGEKARLEALGFSVTAAYHEWTQWRSLYVHDPEGNTVELVCYDPEVA